MLTMTAGGTRGIAEAEGHPSVSKGAEWTGKCGLLLILWCNVDLEVSSVAIQKAVMGLTSQPFQHLIDERKGVMIFPSGLVETSVVNANSPTILHSGWNELILLVGHDSHSGFLWNHLH